MNRGILGTCGNKYCTDTRSELYVSLLINAKRAQIIMIITTVIPPMNPNRRAEILAYIPQKLWLLRFQRASSRLRTVSGKFSRNRQSMVYWDDFIPIFVNLGERPRQNQVYLKKTRNCCLKEVIRITCILSYNLSYYSLITHTQRPFTSSFEVVAKYVIIINVRYI